MKKFEDEDQGQDTGAPAGDEGQGSEGGSDEDSQE